MTAPQNGREGSHASGAARQGMPPWLPKAIAIGLALTAVFDVTVWAARQLVGFGVMLLISFFLAMVMEPAVSRLEARGLSRTPATLIVFAVTLAAIGGFSAAMVTLLIDQATQVSGEVPELFDTLVDRVNRTFHTNITTERLLRGSGNVETSVRQAADHAWGVSTTVIGGVFEVFTIALFARVGCARSGPRIRTAWKPPTPHSARPRKQASLSIPPPSEGCCPCRSPPCARRRPC
ncbi:AI-2E family transporter [Streptomyces shenzhenensis]|nr:AI-2E family transporter [Streptomyces shenzhenensis]